MRETHKEKRAERERERQRESQGGRDREGEAMSKVPQGFLQNSTVLMLRYSESDRALLLDRRRRDGAQSLCGGGGRSQHHLGGRGVALKGRKPGQVFFPKSVMLHLFLL